MNQTCTHANCQCKGSTFSMPCEQVPHFNGCTGEADAGKACQVHAYLELRNDDHGRLAYGDVRALRSGRQAGTTRAQVLTMLWHRPCLGTAHTQAPPMLRHRPCSGTAHAQAPPMLRHRPCSGTAHAQAPPMLRHRPCSGTAHTQAPPLLRHRPCSGTALA